MSNTLLPYEIIPEYIEKAKSLHLAQQEANM